MDITDQSKVALNLTLACLSVKLNPIFCAHFACILFIEGIIAQLSKPKLVASIYLLMFLCKH